MRSPSRSNSDPTNLLDDPLDEASEAVSLARQLIDSDLIAGEGDSLLVVRGYLPILIRAVMMTKLLLS